MWNASNRSASPFQHGINQGISRDEETDLILAVDPGTDKSAFVVLDRKEQRIIDKGIFANSEMFDVIKGCPEITVAIEMVASYGMPVGREVFETCVWIGRFYQAADDMALPIKLVYRKDVKMHLCGSMRAKDANVRQALVDLLGKEKTKGIVKDMWAALGVAVTVAGLN
jgi:Holliday junction resolvasome RuvABC endonuclease subunit